MCTIVLRADLTISRELCRACIRRFSSLYARLFRALRHHTHTRTDTEMGGLAGRVLHKLLEKRNPIIGSTWPKTYGWIQHEKRKLRFMPERYEHFEDHSMLWWSHWSRGNMGYQWNLKSNFTVPLSSEYISGIFVYATLINICKIACKSRNVSNHIYYLYTHNILLSIYTLFRGRPHELDVCQLKKHEACCLLVMTWCHGNGCYAIIGFVTRTVYDIFYALQRFEPWGGLSYYTCVVVFL